MTQAVATETVSAALDGELREVKGQLETLRGNYKSLEEKEQHSLKRMREAEAALAKERDSHSTEMQSFSVSINQISLW